MSTTDEHTSMTSRELTLTLAHLYPEQMSIYGDRGNILTLRQRCQWRGIALDVQPVQVGADIDWSRFDIAFFGGGQDSGQALISDDLRTRQATGLGQAIEHGLVMLAICGGYQLLGHYFLTHTGERLPGIGVLDIYTVGGKKRMIGNTVVETTLLALSQSTTDMTIHPSHAIGHRVRSNYLVGFENHSGRTYHGSGVTSLGTVVQGYGDNGEDGTSGAVYGNTIGCYLHGSLLPKNPHLADELIRRALHRRYGPSTVLAPFDDSLEWQAHDTMVKRLVKR